MADSDSTWVDWSALVASLSADERTSLEQSFTQFAEPGETEDRPYKDQMSESMQAVFEQLERSGDVRQENGKILVAKRLIPDAFHKHL